MPANDIFPENLIQVHRNFGWFWGRFADNRMHRHHAVQLSIGLEGPVRVETESGPVVGDAVLVPANVPHRLDCGGLHLVLLFNPASLPGHYWQLLSRQLVGTVEHPGVEAIRKAAEAMEAGGKPEGLSEVVEKYRCGCGEVLHGGDKRVEQVLVYLEAHRDRVVSLAEAAEHCHLSPERLRHLFREVTGQTFRRAQLWGRLARALASLEAGKLTATAHEAGFSDSAHFSRTFRESFGFSPRELLKNSRFIQV